MVWFLGENYDELSSISFGLGKPNFCNTNLESSTVQTPTNGYQSYNTLKVQTPSMANVNMADSKIYVPKVNHNRSRESKHVT